MNYKIILPVIAGLILIAIAITMLSITNEEHQTSPSISETPSIILTNTPADNYPEYDRAKYCGSGEAKSNDYVNEYKIPTKCTQPQAIDVDPDGNIWFAQSNTGKIAKFDPISESFTEYDNPLWLKSANSMISGLDYSSDNSFWFTDDQFDSVWKFNIDNETYHQYSFPTDGKSLPQKLKIFGSEMIINDLTGNKLTIFDITTSGQNMNPFLIPSPRSDWVTSSFTLDDDKNIWYTTWGEPNVRGAIYSINRTSLESAFQNFTESEYTIDSNYYRLPFQTTIHGINFDEDGNLWLADASSSTFYKFKPIIGSRNYTQYVTSTPSVFTYGNYSGTIDLPLSRPNWIQTDSFGNIVFNQPEANRIGIMNPYTETLVEYEIPSRNPFWGDCGDLPNCGKAQVLEFAISGEKIWFSEWAENNIGYIDTSIPLPIDINLESQQILLESEESKKFQLVVSSNSQTDLPISFVMSNPYSENNLDIQLVSDQHQYLINSKNPIEIDLSLIAGDQISPGEYKVLLGAATDQVSVGKFLTIIIE